MSYWPIGHGGHLVEVDGTGLWVYEAQWVAAIGGDLPADVLMRLVFDGANTRCDELRLWERPDGGRITATTFRQVPLDTLMRAAIDRRVVYTVGDDGRPIATYGESVKARYRKGLASLAARGRRRTGDDELERVAATYRAAVADGGNPTAAVERELRLPNRNTAKKWVQRARAAGKLPAALGERRGGIASESSTVRPKGKRTP